MHIHIATNVLYFDISEETHLIASYAMIELEISVHIVLLVQKLLSLHELFISNFLDINLKYHINLHIFSLNLNPYFCIVMESFRWLLTYI